MAPTLASTEVSSDYTGLRNITSTFPVYELSFGTSLAKVGYCKNSNLCCNIGTDDRFTTKVDNTE